MLVQTASAAAPRFLYADGYDGEPFITLHFDIALDAANPPPLNAFELSINGNTYVVTGVTVNSVAKTVQIAFLGYGRLFAGDFIAIIYDDFNGGNAVNAIQGLDGADADQIFATTQALDARPAPAVTTINPPSGSTAGGASVTITGTSFTGARGVTIGGTAATGVTVVNDTTITCTTPAGLAGTASVVVTNFGGANAANALYTYVTPTPAPAPAITITSAANLMTLFWPDTATGYRLESTVSFTPTGTWNTVSGTFQTNGGFINLGLPMTGARMFYRLSKP